MTLTGGPASLAVLLRSLAASPVCPVPAVHDNAPRFGLTVGSRGFSLVVRCRLIRKVPQALMGDPEEWQTQSKTTSTI